MPKAPTAASARKRIRELGDPNDALFLQGYFKTGPGEYGEGDQFLGIRVPVVRRLAKELRDLPLDQIEALLRDRWHEARLLALVLLGDAYERASPAEREAIFDLYLRNTKWINNWDLVDSSAGRVVGAHLANRPRKLLARLARSPRPAWFRRRRARTVAGARRRVRGAEPSPAQGTVRY